METKVKKGRYVFSFFLNILIIAAATIGVLSVVSPSVSASFGIDIGTVYGYDIAEEWWEAFLMPEVDAFVLLGIAGFVSLIFSIAGMAGKTGCRFPPVFKYMMLGAALALICHDAVEYFVAGDAFPYASDDWFLWPLILFNVEVVLSFLSVFFEISSKKIGVWNMIWPILPVAGILVTFYVLDYNGTMDQLKYHVVYSYYGSEVEVWEPIIYMLVTALVAMIFAMVFIFIHNGIRGKDVKPDTAGDALEEADQERYDSGEGTTAEIIREQPAPESEQAPEEKPKKVVIVKSKGDTIKPLPKEEKQPQKKAAAPAAKAEAKEEPKEAPESKASDKEAKPAPAPASTQKPSGYKGGARVYHISRNADGKWQVKLATGERAIKLFRTQEEAINYAKELVKTQGGSIRVHSLAGKMRKH